MKYRAIDGVVYICYDDGRKTQVYPNNWSTKSEKQALIPSKIPASYKVSGPNFNKEQKPEETENNG